MLLTDLDALDFFADLLDDFLLDDFELLEDFFEFLDDLDDPQCDFVSCKPI